MTLRNSQIKKLLARAYAVTIQNRIADVLYYHNFSNDTLTISNINAVH